MPFIRESTHMHFPQRSPNHQNNRDLATAQEEEEEDFGLETNRNGLGFNRQTPLYTHEESLEINPPSIKPRLEVSILGDLTNPITPVGEINTKRTGAAHAAESKKGGSDHHAA